MWDLWLGLGGGCLKEGGGELREGGKESMGGVWARWGFGEVWDGMFIFDL